MNLTIREFTGKLRSKVRFGGIENFDEGKEVFATLTFETLHYLRYSRTESSKLGRLVLDIQFDRWDERCVIRCSKLEVVDAESTGV